MVRKIEKQEAMDPQVPVILGMNILKELYRQMAKEIRHLYCKELPTGSFVEDRPTVKDTRGLCDGHYVI